MSRPHPVSRRRFLQASAAAGFALGVPAFLRGQNLNSKLNIAVIGCGGRGGSNLSSVASENIVGLCDVNISHVDRAGQQHQEARKATDFRRLFDKDKEFDAVVVSTCEHTHAFATLPALQLGKHVYCEKPLTHSIWEARIIREAAAKAKVATQMGTQIHAGDNYRRVVELIQTGAIGPVRECHVWVSRAWGRQSPEDAKKLGDIVNVQERPAGSSPVPAGLDWDLWLGPAPERPFHEVYFPGPKWYRWWDFGSGTMSDLGSHWNDLPFWALKLQTPKVITASGPPPHPELAPASMQATYEYDARGDMPAVKMTWYQGVEKPQIWIDKKIPQWDSACLFIGDKGMLLADYGKLVLLPEENFKDFKRPEPFIPKSLGHHAEWIHACKTGEPTTCNFEYAGQLTEANHLGNVAYRTGKKIVWDAANMKALGVPEADPIIRREYRAGMEVGLACDMFDEQQKWDEPLPKHLRVRWSARACSCAIVAAIFLVAVLIHLRWDRDKDGLVLEPVGPFARYVYSMAITGYGFTVVAAILGFLAKDREWSRTAIVLSNTCLTLVTIIALATFGILMAIVNSF